MRLGLFLVALSAYSQTVPPALLQGLQWRSIGPAATGGRIADLAVSRVPGEPLKIYAATATGGVFKSVNEGVSWTPIFDNAGAMMSIGAIAVAPSDPSVLWVGTGEADNRQSSSWGDGVYKSVDGGTSWQKAGLEETRHVGRIVIHPTDPNTVYVAAVGHLWGSNPERGVFKTSDGGRTWKKVLYKDEHTGATDLAIDPAHPDVVYAALYQRQRKGWGYNGGGPGSGLYRTRDGGQTWTELKNGLPGGQKGRSGLAVFPGDSRTLFAIVEAQSPTGGVFRSLDQGETWEHMSGLNPRPSYYSRIEVDPKNANRVYIMGSNRGFYISDDAGRSFRDVFSGVHSEDHALWINPENTNHLVIGGDGGVSISFDRGASWLFRLNMPLGQFYNISTNNAEPFLVCGGLQDNGSWCTPSATSMSYGISFKDAFNIGGGDGMHAQFAWDDHTLLVSSQNGVTGRLDLRSMQRQSIGPVPPPERGQPPYRWYWTSPLIVSRFDPNTIYTGAQMVFRSPDRGVTWKAISPDLTANVDRDPLQMMGAPVPPRALSRNDGQPTFSALTAVAESPLDRSVLYAGADDGSLSVTRDGGQHWTSLAGKVPGLPDMLNISGIAASRFAAGRVYLTVDGHFNDDYLPYVYMSEDYGEHWRSIVSGLPRTSVHRIREHPASPDLLVVAMEAGVYASFDRGAHWSSLNANLPPVPVYDVVFQQSEGALVAGTHGRGIWVLDHAEPLSQITAEVLGKGRLFPVPPTHDLTIYAGQFWFGAGEFFAPNPFFGAIVTYYLPKDSGPVQISIADAAGRTIRTFRGPGQAGLNRTCWDLRLDPPVGDVSQALGNCAGNISGLGFAARGPSAGPRVLPGRYTVSVAPAGAPAWHTEVRVLADPRFTISEADRNTRYASLQSAYLLQQRLVPARDTAMLLAGQSTGKPLAATVSQIQVQINGALAAAARAQSAIDSYDGLPTAAQLQELDWAWSDGVAAVTALNRVIQQQLPGLAKTVAVPTRD